MLSYPPLQTAPAHKRTLMPTLNLCAKYSVQVIACFYRPPEMGAERITQTFESVLLT